jgi:nicotinate-nucleotide adenylyltransferase
MIEARRPVVRIRRPIAGKAATTRASRLRIGLLGGSFNPAHEGHLAISLEALKRLGLDRVWWLVSPQNPLKPTAEASELEERLVVARAIVVGHPRILVTDLERRLGTRYTVDTLRWLTRRSRARFVWLIGADNLAQLPLWRHWRRVVRMVPIAVFDREPYSYVALTGQVAAAYAGARIKESEAATLVGSSPPAWVYLRLRRHRESSTAIRRQQPATRGSRQAEKWS